ncbi:hypothetical protein [Tautonia plasticadhaerens]|uniref:Uncharacterized protein n=1 Tax=Tautonia plasticadhaerens TaxID=2527974 RepID=A0A518GVP0_9BACT|nr:hypothetical protein [Tautonia plasticadhaerens]QDV32629.1 hypothetical protein ElP_04640 [Tautonia plasticadhaerens]
MRRRTFAILILGLALSPSAIGSGGPAGWFRAERGRGLFSAGRPMPGPAGALVSDRGRPGGLVRGGHRPFGSVHGGLETGIGFGYPAPYPTGGGTAVSLPRLFHGR